MTAMATLYGTHQGPRVLKQVFFEISEILYHTRLKICKSDCISNGGKIIMLNLDKYLQIVQPKCSS